MLIITDTQQMIIETAEKVASAFGPEYWRKCDENEIYPTEFVDELGAQGFFGLAVPETMGGSGQGMTELCLAMDALCRGGGGGGPALGYLFGLLGTLTLVKSASTLQAEQYLAPFARGEKICAFALSEPDAGTNSFNIKTTAVAEGGGFRINGNKWFITNIDNSDALLLVAKTAPSGKEAVKSGSLSLFLIDLPNESLDYTPIPKHGFNYYKSNQLFIEDLFVPESALVGTLGKGFASLAPTLNAERLLVAAGSIGLARLALSSAVLYASERVVFDVPIGAHQAVQHPLAAAHARLESAWWTVRQAAAMEDQGDQSAHATALANTAKYVAVEAAIDACYHSLQAHGGAGYAREYHQERWWREVQLFRLAPLTQQMTLNFIGQHVLGLPRSY